jgi:long-chain acyl-CoA synthetase
LPLSHIFERLVFCSLFYSGAKIIFFGGDVLKIRDDWQLVKPSLMAVVPRLLNRFLIK